jgi:hypothetical protein
MDPHRETPHDGFVGSGTSENTPNEGMVILFHFFFWEHPA